MSWADAFGLLRLLGEKHIGAPSREAKLANEEREIERMRAEIGDMRDYRWH